MRDLEMRSFRAWWFVCGFEDGLFDGLSLGFVFLVAAVRGFAEEFGATARRVSATAAAGFSVFVVLDSCVWCCILRRGVGGSC